MNYHCQVVPVKLELSSIHLLLIKTAVRRNDWKHGQCGGADIGGGGSDENTELAFALGADLPISRSYLPILR